MSKNTVVICVTVALFAACLPAAAEVAVNTDRRGAYVSTRVVASGPAWQPDIWTVRPGRAVVRGPERSLNPDGDLNGDLWPAVAESPLKPFYPWAVWSRQKGASYDLAYSRWTGRGWTPIAWVQDQATAFDELDADLSFDRGGRPFVTYWVDRDGVGEVWLSFFLSSRWSAPFRVSDDGVDARWPRIREIDGAAIVVDFETPDGSLSQTVLFKRPISITDDINPQFFLMLSGAPVDYQRAN